MSRGTFWPVFLGVLLALGVGANLVLLLVASGDPSFAVERDYYRKGIEWDRTLAQRRANARLGWALSCDVRRGGAGLPSSTMTVRLEDAAGVPIPDASISLEAFHNARAAQIVEASLPPAGAGAYRADLALVRPGLWELRFRAVRGEDVFTKTLSYALAPRPRP